MKCREPGVLECSEYYFSTPSNLAKRLFFYPVCAGEFYCTRGYRVKRENYNSLLVMLILEGELSVRFAGKSSIAQAGDVVFLNCYEPHQYFSDTPLRFMFLHFDGNVSMDFYETVTKAKEHVFPLENPATLQETLSEIYRDLQNQSVSESRHSCLIQSVLCELLTGTGTQHSEADGTESTIQARGFIEKNYSLPLSVAQIAETVNVSVYHFSRIFKQDTGYSPHEYLVKCRIDKAKHLLKSTQKSVSEIAFAVGYQSESNFIYAFREKVGMSPNRFRKMPF